MNEKKKLRGVELELQKAIQKADVGAINAQPTFEVLFTTLARVAIQKGQRGILCVILEDSTAGEAWETLKGIADITTEKFTTENVALLTTAYDVFSPSKILVRRKDATEISDIIKEVQNKNISQLAFPTATAEDDNMLSLWAKGKDNKRGVVYVTALSDKSDSCNVVEVANTVIKHKLVKDYTPQMFTVALAGAIAGCPLNRSLDQITFGSITMVDDVEPKLGKFTLFNDDEDVRVVLAVNSKTTFDDVWSEETRYIKIYEGMNIISLDIKDTFRKYWAGIYPNTYDNKIAFCDNINKIYFEELKPNVLSPTMENEVSIDVEANKRHAIKAGFDPDVMTETEIKTFNTGTNVYLKGKVSLQNTMVNLFMEINY